MLRFLHNIRQADHINVKLNAINCRITPWRDYGAENYSFATEEFEILGHLKHRRWCEEKEREGWKWAQKRDDNLKLHPDLIRWEDSRLSETARDKDREAVLLIPKLRAHAGFRIEKLPIKSKPVYAGGSGKPSRI